MGRASAAVVLATALWLGACFSSNRATMQLGADPATPCDACAAEDSAAPSSSAAHGDPVDVPPRVGAGGGAGSGFADVAGTGGVAGSAGNDDVAGSGGASGVGGVAGMEVMTVAGGGAATEPVDALAGCDAPGAYDPLAPAAGETCYELAIHALSDPADTTPFDFNPGEAYHQFYYDVPWSPGTLATRLGTRFDAISVIHSWRLFSSMKNVAGGTVETNVTGTTLGEQARLLGAWHVGACNLTLPTDVGLQLPDAGKLMIQLHVYNATGVHQMDTTHVQICTLPEGSRPNVAGLTFLGTENLNGITGMPPGMNEFTSSCPNDSPEPIHFVAVRPHMHLTGIEMRSELRRAAGGTEVFFDQPFAFDDQIHYTLDPRPVLQPGDDVVTTCTFFNDTGRNVAFGESTNQEMCYQLTYTYPAGALDNGVLSLVGALNTCW